MRKQRGKSLRRVKLVVQFILEEYCRLPRTTRDGEEIIARTNKLSSIAVTLH
jgi:hypothetical protein